MIGSNLLIGGPIVATLLACWNYISGVISKIRSLFIINVTVEGSLADAVAFYCWRNLKRIRIGDRKYAGRKAFVRSRERYQHIAYEIFGQSGVVFWKGFTPLSVGTKSNDGQNNNGDPYGGGGGPSLNFTFLRGTWDIDKLISDAIDLYNEHNYKGFQKKRFYVVRKYGSFGTNSNFGSGNRVESVETDDRICLWDKRLVGIASDDIGQQIHESGEPFEALAMPDEVWQAVKDIERWKKSEKWYKEKNIPWKRGWLLHGPPGTGKTSMVRAIGEYLDIPVLSFALSSFTDREFQEEWDDLRSHIPCIALIEDIDTVFKGRENITKGGQMQKPLSFDTVLNTIDGISSSDGVFTMVTTNRLEYLDPALGRPTDGNGISTRPGRIDKIVKLDVLDENCRRQIADRILSDCPEIIDDIVKKGNGDTGAQFQDRCSKIALSKFWDKEDAETKRFGKLKETNLKAHKDVQDQIMTYKQYDNHIEVCNDRF